MAQFKGSIIEFNNFIGGYSRNKVQYLTRKYKKKIGKCENCGSRTKKLEAAHLKGKERPLIISQILQDYTEKGIIEINLNSFEEQYLKAHDPIEKTIKVLCKPCHIEYDKSEKIISNRSLNEGERIVEFLSINKLSKRNALKLFNIAELNINNTIYSNINNSLDVYWLEPSNDKFRYDLNLILNDSINKKLSLFRIPANSVDNPELTFEQRKDRDSSKIIIDSKNLSFIDKNGFDLKEYLVVSQTY